MHARFLNCTAHYLSINLNCVLCKMNISVVVKLLVDRFGVSYNKPSLNDFIVTEEISRFLYQRESEVGSRNDSDGDDEDEDENENDNEDEDDDVFEEYEKEDSLHPSYVERAYKYWTKQTDQPLQLLPHVEKRSFSSVQSKFKKIKVVTTLQKYQTKMLNGNIKENMRKINERVKVLFDEARKDHHIVHDRNIRQWGIVARTEIDTNNKIKFSAGKRYV